MAHLCSASGGTRVHPVEGPADKQAGRHSITFMCDDIHATVADLRAKGVHIDGEPKNEGFGIVITMTLPGEVKVMLYQPRHALAIQDQAI
ncbi:MAG TPA: VOC family protein [Bryobacteraceae bacterium]|jgi:hypothetical protein|nr:VOC family protein [Bryobacteraceae bacterium]